MNNLNDVLLIGVGGAGCRLADAIVSSYPEVRALWLDTDARTLPDHAEQTVLFGAGRLMGKGTGGETALGKQAMADDLAALVLPRIEGVRLAVVVTALGGGTGSGATPELLKELRRRGIITLCFVTTPFLFESSARRQIAHLFLPLFENNADALVVTAFDELFRNSGDLPIGDALDQAEEMFKGAVTAFWRLLLTPGFIEFDTERLMRVLRKSGSARFAVFSADDAARTETILRKIRESPLLRHGKSISEAQTILLGIFAGRDLRLVEISEIVNGIRTYAEEGEVEFGTVLDPEFEGTVQVILFTFDVWIAPPEESQPTPVEAVNNAVDRVPAEMEPLRKPGRAKRRQTAPAPTVGKGRFRDVDATIYEGQDLDKPAYLRKNITLDR